MAGAEEDHAGRGREEVERGVERRELPAVADDGRSTIDVRDTTSSASRHRTQVIAAIWPLVRRPGEDFGPGLSTPHPIPRGANVVENRAFG